jgi:AraC-like DNA-binding protein
VLRRYPEVAPHVLEAAAALDPEERVPILGMLESLRRVVRLTGDPDLGLKAARAVEPGEHGLIDFLINSATDLRDVVGMIGRYLPLLNEALEFTYQIEDGRCRIALGSRLLLPRTAADYQAGAFFTGVLQRSLVSPDRDYDCEVCFTHQRPADITEYTRTFLNARLQFGAEFNGFVFQESLLDVPLPRADAGLHAVLRRHGDVLLAELPKAEKVADKLRKLISQELSHGEPSASFAAHALRMSGRTLARKLEREGTTFKTVLDDTRRVLALHYLAEQTVDVTAIAMQLGFAHTSAFFRAFRRWTGSSPLEYRRGQQAATEG